MRKLYDEAWEKMWAPYDEQTYAAVLEALAADDVVLDIGAGDCRLARRMAQKVRKVYAIESNPDLVAAVGDLPLNCELFAADAREVEFAFEISAAVLLMRHCRHFALYWNKLKDTGCRRLIGNARWGMGIEIIEMSDKRVSFNDVAMGWYACRCGETGFVTGKPELLSEVVLDTLWEVNDCPKCAGEAPRK